MIIHNEQQKSFFDDFLASTTGKSVDAIRSRDSEVNIALRFMEFGCFINFFIAAEPKNKQGTRAMQWLESLADKHDVPLYALVSPIGHNGIVDREKLKKWYLGLGFVELDDARVAYFPE